MLILALILAVGVLAAGTKAVRDVLHSLPRSNDDWLWY